MPQALTLQLGVKADPIEYRYSYEWLFRLLAEEDVHRVQFGSFFEVYQLPDDYFHGLRRLAEQYGICIHSLFTTHRELGGFFRDEPGWEAIARRNYERFIQVGAMLGAASVGQNPGAVLRDRMDTKEKGVQCYLRHMRELLGFAKACGVPRLTLEPMSCLAEPPTLPDEMRRIGDDLNAWHATHPATTAAFGVCADVAHGYADQDGRVVWDNLQLLEAALPYLSEIHLKNTDAIFNATFGFSPKEREKGIIDVRQIRTFLLANQDKIPVTELTGYLELGGPKLGRDYSDGKLADQFRESLRYLKSTFLEK